MNFKLFFSLLKFEIISFFAEAYINAKHNDFWQYKSYLQQKKRATPTAVYIALMRKYNAFIGFNASIGKPHPVTPHGLNGIHISEKACIGKNCTILQQVTIGSNTIAGHKRYGSPKIGDNVFIGAGAKIIGNVTIGDNCRIGANCVVVTDMMPNTTAVLPKTIMIHKNADKMDNNFAGVNN